MIEHIPVFFLLIPLIAAIIVSFTNILSKKDIIQKIITGLSLALPFYFLYIVFQEIKIDTISYDVGGWLKPYGITMVIDELSFILLLVTAILGFLTFIYSLKYVKKEVGKFYFFFLLLMTGLNGIFLSGDVFNLYIFFDLTIICSFILITFGEDRYSYKGSIKYLILGTLASLFFLLAIGFIYAETGLLNLEYLKDSIPLINTQTQIIIFTMLLAAIGIKSAIIPFHTWLVDAHSTAPIPISALLSGIIVKAGVYLFLRINSFGFDIPNMKEVILFLGAITAVGGVIYALIQWDIKKITASHTISQIGIVFIGIGTFSSIGMAGGILHLVNHAFFKALLFLCAGAIIYKTGTKDIREHRIGMSMPITLILYIIGILAISGITPFNGSVSKLLIEQSLNNYPFIYSMLIFTGIGTVASFSKIIYYSFFKNPEKKFKNIKNNEAPILFLIPMIILAFLCLFIGISPHLWLDTFILPASFNLSSFTSLNVSFIQPINIFKEWIIVAGGILILFFIIRISSSIDPIRDRISKIKMNQSIVFMIVTLIIISIIFGALNY
jgi:multicomponent Na+:H+ antiporter subunit D